MMVDVDEESAVRDVVGDAAEAVQGGAVGRDDDIELVPRGGLAEAAVRIEEAELRRDGILIPDGDFLPGSFEREGQSKLGADAIAIGPDVADDADGARVLERGQDGFNDLWKVLHGAGKGEGRQGAGGAVLAGGVVAAGVFGA